MEKDKHGKHKESCKKYQSEGRREKNKAIRQQKHEKRMAKFAKRREEGKSYTYNPDGAGTNQRRYKVENAEKSRAEAAGEYRRWAQAYGRLDHAISAERERQRAEEIKNRKVKKGSESQ